MNETLQTQLFDQLQELTNLAPDVRFGQLLAHLGFLCEDQFGESLADVDDDKLLQVISRHRSELESATPAVAADPS